MEEVAPVLVTLVLSFLIGLEREEHSGGRHYSFGGVRTFPLIGLCGYMTAKLAEGPILIGVGLFVFGALMWLSYRKKLELSPTAGLTSEVSGIFTFLLGAVTFHHALWEATALAVIVLLLLEAKSGLEGLAKKIPSEEIFTFTRFLLISAVILPVVPNESFTELQLNPFKIWLVAVAISGLSYAAYIIERWLGSRRSLLFAAALGGIYSSTSATVVLAKRSQEEKPGDIFSGAIVIASGFMYFRLLVLLAFFNWDLGRQLLMPFSVLGVLFMVIGSLWMRLAEKTPQHHVKFSGRNPLELQSAFIFAALFGLMSVLTALSIKYLGSAGMFSLAFLTGLTDVDPFVMSLTQSVGSVVNESMAVKGIIIATASNNLIKGIYAAIFGAGGVRKYGSATLMVLGLFSLLALVFV